VTTGLAALPGSPHNPTVEHTSEETRPSAQPFFPRVFAAGMTDRGRVREKNEDQFVVAEMTRAMHIRATSLPQPPAIMGETVRGHLFIVADGMGGHNAGEQASALAVMTIEDFLLNTLRWFFTLQGDALLTEFQNALRAADDRVFAESRRRPETRGMGTTLTFAYASEDKLYVVHAGDSRLYVLRDGTLFQITTDHTLVGELVRQHIIDEKAAQEHPMRNVITNSIGGDRQGVNPEVTRIALHPHDAVLVCSDGLTEMVPDAQITEVLQTVAEPAAACARLVEMANAAGGADNVTVVVARFVP
jgi:serine/threonine protein phosphatase PrpC